MTDIGTKVCRTQCGIARARWTAAVIVLVTLVSVLGVAAQNAFGGAGQADVRPVSPVQSTGVQTPVLPAYPTMGEGVEGPAKVLRVESPSAVVVMLGGKEERVRLMGVAPPAPALPVPAPPEPVAETPAGGEGDAQPNADAPAEQPITQPVDAWTLCARELLVGEDVWVQRHRGSRSDGAVRTDRDGSAYVYLFRSPDGLLMNLEIVRRGIAKADVRYGFDWLPVFKAYQGQAQSLKRGVWSEPSPEPAPKKPALKAKPKPGENAAPPSPAPPSPATGDTDAKKGNKPAEEAKPTPSKPDVSDSERVWVTENGSKYHAHDCRYAKDGKPMSRGDAKKKGLSPCKVCKPDEHEPDKK